MGGVKSNFESEPVLGDVLPEVFESVNTPAFVYDEEYIRHRCEHMRKIADEAGCVLLYALKPLTLPGVLKLIAPSVHGLSASSLFESKIARNELRTAGTVHLTTPGLRPSEIGQISELCDYISFNSFSQLWRHRDEVAGKVKVGLRVNPELSFLGDSRYDPSRPYSKLGESISKVRESLDHGAECVPGLSGLLIHNNYGSPDFQELLSTVQKVENDLSRLLKSLEWINLGGGYLFDAYSVNIEAFYEAVWLLKSRYSLEVFIEPGSAFVRDAGFLVSSIIDMIELEGKMIAVLDTSVNHLPEVFEYQWRPDVLLDFKEGDYSYILAGSTCLAGDVFGEYSFAKPLGVGSKLVVTGVGAYNLVKAHNFNGLLLPSIYSLRPDRTLTLVKEFTLEEHSQRWGFDSNGSFRD